MNQKINVGIIGLGFMGSTHFRIYRDHPLAGIRAIADIDEAKIRGDWRKIIGNIGNEDNSIPIDLSGIICTSDPMDLIRDPDIQLIDICLPTYLHKDFILSALGSGKHVLCEKPIALNTKDAREILEASKNSKGNLMIGMCIRFWPEYRHAHQTVTSGKIGKIKSATFRRISPDISKISWENWFMKEKSSGGAILDLHLHDTDAIRYIFGRPVRVTSFGMKGFRSDSAIDHVVTHYDFEDDRLICSEGSWAPAAATPFEMSFLIVGEKGTLRLSETGYKIIYEDGKIESPFETSPVHPTGWHAEIDYLLNCIRDDIVPEDYVTVEETIESLSIIEAEVRSVREGKTTVINY